MMAQVKTKGEREGLQGALRQKMLEGQNNLQMSN